MEDVNMEDVKNLNVAGMWKTKQGWKGRHQQDLSTPHLQNCFIYSQVKEGCKKFKNPEIFRYWHSGLTCMDRSRSCLSSKGPWAANANFPQLGARSLLRHSVRERKIQAGQMVGRKQLPTAAGSSKNPGKSSKKSREEQPKHSSIQAWDRESREQEAGQERKVGTSSVCTAWPKKNELKIHLGGFSDLSPFRISVKNYQ